MPRQLTAKMALTVKGGASKKERLVQVPQNELEQDLLTFLRSRSFPVASSCEGAGQCGKCVFNNSLLACQELVKDFLETEVVFDYM